MAVDVVIYYNPIILSFADGILTDSVDNDVVRNAIEQVVENLPFNGDCRTSDILNAIKIISGVDVVEINKVEVWTGDQQRQTVVGFTTPESGYFKLQELTITAHPYGIDEIKNV
jgi:hypothetical protein